VESCFDYALTPAMDQTPYIQTPKLPRNIHCPLCPKRFCSRKALRDHSKTLHASLPPFQSEAIISSLPQTSTKKHSSVSKALPPPDRTPSKQATDPIPITYVPLLDHNPTQTPPDSLPATTPATIPSTKPATALELLTTLLQTLSVSRRTPAAAPTPTPKPPIEPPSTALDDLIRQSHQALGYGCLFLKTDIDTSRDEYVTTHLPSSHPPPPLDPPCHD